MLASDGRLYHSEKDMPRWSRVLSPNLPNDTVIVHTPRGKVAFPVHVKMSVLDEPVSWATRLTYEALTGQEWDSSSSDDDVMLKVLANRMGYILDISTVCRTIFAFGRSHRNESHL